MWRWTVWLSFNERKSEFHWCKVRLHLLFCVSVHETCFGESLSLTHHIWIHHLLLPLSRAAGRIVNTAAPAPRIISSRRARLSGIANLSTRRRRRLWSAWCKWTILWKLNPPVCSLHWSFFLHSGSRSRCNTLRLLKHTHTHIHNKKKRSGPEPRRQISRIWMVFQVLKRQAASGTGKFISSTVRVQTSEHTKRKTGFQRQIFTRNSPARWLLKEPPGLKQWTDFVNNA